jgi:polyhydroxybutyrate depolymerase
LQNAPAAANAAIFVFPQGIPYQNYGVGWNDLCGGYDMVFFDHMLAALESTYCVDPTRVFAAGFSWGCDQVTALLCCRGGDLRAIAAASCSDEFQGTADGGQYDNLPCPAAGTTAIRFTHDANGDQGYTLLDFELTSALYRDLDFCAASASPVPPAPCETYAGCRAPYIECPYPGLGHALPSGWAADTWTFFSKLQ